jgi:hypothetical protein
MVRNIPLGGYLLHAIRSVIDLQLELCSSVGIGSFTLPDSTADAAKISKWTKDRKTLMNMKDNLLHELPMNVETNLDVVDYAETGLAPTKAQFLCERVAFIGTNPVSA